MTYSAWLDQVVGASLVTWDANNNLVAQLAAEVPSAANGDVSADGLTITFKVETKPQMVRWPTADIERCALYLANPGGSEERPHQPRQAMIKSPALIRRMTPLLCFISKPCTLPGRLCSPWVRIQLACSFLPIFSKVRPASRRMLRSTSPTVGAGAYMIKEWVAGDHMTLVANPNYYGAKPKICQINIKFVPDTTTALAALKTGDVDFVPDFAEGDIPTLSCFGPCPAICAWILRRSSSTCCSTSASPTAPKRMPQAP